MIARGHTSLDVWWPRDASVIERLWSLAQEHKIAADAEFSFRHADSFNSIKYNPELEHYHRGKAFAYEHAARMLEGTDGS